MKRIIAVSLALSLALLYGCAGEAPPTETQTQPTTLPTETAGESTASTQPAETAPEAQPEAVFQEPLTGALRGSPQLGRIFAVSFNNVTAALPQHGIAQADMVWEFLTEGGTTRCIGLFSDIASVPAIGSVRSARMYFIDLARAFDAVLVHSGSSWEAEQAFKTLGWPHIDGGNAAPFYRDSDRRAQGYAWEHTLFAKGEGLPELAKKQGISTGYEQPKDFGLTFLEDAAPQGESASWIRIVYGIGGKTTSMTYDETTGQYLAGQFGADWVDGADGGTLAFENVLVLQANTWLQEDQEHYTVELVGEGTGWFACGGSMAQIRWSRADEDASFVFTLADGTPLTLGIGKSYVAVVPQNSKVVAG